MKRGISACAALATVALLSMLLTAMSADAADGFDPGPHPGCVYPDPYTFVAPHDVITKVQYLPMDYAGLPIRWVFIDSDDENAKILVLSCDGRALAQEQLDWTSFKNVDSGPGSPRGYTVLAHRKILGQAVTDMVAWLAFENGKIVHLWDFPAKVLEYWPDAHGPKWADSPGATRVRSRMDEYEWLYSTIDDSIEVHGVRTLNLKKGGEVRYLLPSGKFCFKAESEKFVPCGTGSPKPLFNNSLTLEGY